MGKNKTTSEIGKKCYPRSVLYRLAQKTYRGRNLDEIEFPLGGIGTGMISLGGWGQLCQFEIQNRPQKGLPEAVTDFDAFFALKVTERGQKPVVKILQGPAGGLFSGRGHGMRMGLGEGLPHFRKVVFRGEFPLAKVFLQDQDIPLKVSLEAFNPFIPLNEDDSGIPIAVFLYHLVNLSNHVLRGSVYGSLNNFIGYPDKTGQKNTAFYEQDHTGLFMLNTALNKDLPSCGTMALSTSWSKARVWQNWPADGYGRRYRFWKIISESGSFPPPGTSLTGTVAADFSLTPMQRITIPFFIAWHFPNTGCAGETKPGEENKTRKPPASGKRNYYTRLWADACVVTAYVVRNFGRLYRQTERFHNALFRSTLPGYVLDSISSQLAILKTTTCIRLDNGTLFGFEGCHDNAGCCGKPPVSSPHVWYYAQALPYLFPALQRTVRQAELRNRMSDPSAIRLSCADGHLSNLLQLYREWLLCGDDQWLKELWPYAKNALKFAWKYWDRNKDGIMEGMQHTTYDNAFFGPNSMVGSLYLGALLAAEKIARHLGEEKQAEEYQALFLSGSQWTDRNLFNGEYYEQKVISDIPRHFPEEYKQRAAYFGKDDTMPWPKWQYGKGCLSDQLIGQWYATMLNLGYLYARKNVRKTLRAIFDYNWLPDLTNHVCTQRYFALNGEAGLVLATWPKGERPGDAFFYADEVWTGTEYQVASHLIYEGFVDEGLSIVRGLRLRYDGTRRNPWDEIECGHYYARAMASYALLPALAGFSYSAPEKTIGFSPRIFAENFQAFFSTGSGWGTYRQRSGKNFFTCALSIAHGCLHLGVLKSGASFPRCAFKKSSVRIGKKPVKADIKLVNTGLRVAFDAEIQLAENETLSVELRW